MLTNGLEHLSPCIVCFRLFRLLSNDENNQLTVNTKQLKMTIT